MSEIPIYILANETFYRLVPAETLRHTVDNLFPALAKDTTADCLAGALHRYRGGHDLIWDVGSTLKEQGISKALHQAGHILLTDLPTKSGIPLPLLSRNALGGTLESAGINPAWFNVNLGDAVFGGLAVAEGYSDLAAAISGELPMDFSGFCDTFGEGTLELILSRCTNNPLVLAAGIENITAGLIAAWKEFSWYVAPDIVLGAAGVSGVCGAVISKCLLKQDDLTVLQNSCRSAATGAMFSISSAFGLGLVGAMLWGEVVRRIAEKHNRESKDFYRAAGEQLELLKNSLNDVLPEFDSFYKQACSGAVIKRPMPILESGAAGLDAAAPEIPSLELLDTSA